MSQLKFRQLIDLAIGSPEPGHVNFYALHVLLYSFADKLNIIDDPVDCDNYDEASLILNPSVKQQVSDKSIPRKLESMRDTERLDKYGASTSYSTNKSARNTARGLSKGGASNKNRLTGGAESNEEDAPEEPVKEAEAPTAETEVAAAPEETAEVAAPPPSSPAEEPSPEATEAPPTVPVPPKADVSPIVSSHKEIEDGNVELKSSIQDIDERLSHLEVNLQSDIKRSPDIIKGISIMKDQLELAMEELRIIINVLTDNKVIPRRIDRLTSLSKKLVNIQRRNVYIETVFFTALSEQSDLSAEEEHGEEHEPSESIDVQSQPSYTGVLPVRDTKEDQYELDLHLCYSPEKILDQLMELKSEFCILTNKINEITATILEQDCQRTTLLLTELQKQMHEGKFFMSTLKEKQDSLELREQQSVGNILQLSNRVRELSEEKIDTTAVEILLADKTNYSQLQRKVSIEFVQEMQCRLDKQFCEIRKLISINEKNSIQMMENMRTSLGLASVDEVLRKFKEKIDGDIHFLQDTLKKYIEATDDECAAAGARMKVLQDLACLSCDTTCVMRTMEKAKVGRLPNAHATSLLSPLITYELGSIRKSGIMGYYRKDEFPHAPNAWMNRQNVKIKACVPRHAGGSHTTYTAKDYVEKVLQTKK